MRRIWKGYFEDLYNTDTREQVAVHMCDFDGVRRGNYFGGEPIMKMEGEVRVWKFIRMERLHVRMRSQER